MPKVTARQPIQGEIGAGALIEYLRTVKLLYKKSKRKHCLLQLYKVAGLVARSGAVKPCHVILLGAGKGCCAAASH